MKRVNESTGFWASGACIFADELAKEEKARLEPLQSKIKAESDPVRKAGLEREVAEIKAEFSTRRRNAAYSLFSRG